jgi:hypothetical protein
MSTYNAIAWLPLCAGLTGIGLVASWFAMRKRGLASGLHGAAWSLLPLGGRYPAEAPAVTRYPAEAPAVTRYPAVAPAVTFVLRP